MDFIAASHKSMRADVSADADADAEGTGSGNAMEPKVLANHFVGGPQDLQGESLGCCVRIFRVR